MTSLIRESVSHSGSLLDAQGASFLRVFSRYSVTEFFRLNIEHTSVTTVFFPIPVDKGNHMVGSYGPKKEMHVYRTPEEDAPSGMLARGDYKVESRFTDDDKHIYLEWEWHLSIKKDFE